MKLVSFTPRGPKRLGGSPRGRRPWTLGALAGDGSVVVPLKRSVEALTGASPAGFGSMLALIRAGGAALETAREALEFARSEGGTFLVPLDTVVLGPPLPDPMALRCCSVFTGHHRNCARTLRKWRTGETAGEVAIPEAFFQIPGYYKGNHLNLIGPEDTITFPSGATHLDFELELAAVVGGAGRDIPRGDAARQIFGWSIFNDASARHPQLEEMALGTGPNKSKDFDGGNVLGPCIVTADEFDPRAAIGIARVNGVEWGRGEAADMAHDWGAILEYRSRSERLHPGEIITSGCFTNCSGVEHDRFLEPGDVVELEIPGIGVLRNPVAQSAA
ncbi:MAG TPA: fumarylacetoacetate hydrolase family protein [Candidatus Polarisedimenticolia bacterium]|nr:fumarylacetoacetate hydrolase family protein [Candidatus Polarisedimenticolia bacterium]